MAIVDADAAARAGWTMIDLAAAYLSGGATLLQLRAKKAASAWLLDIATVIVALAHRANAMVIVNDRADIARLSGADGVHVGQDDLAPAAVRQIIGAGAGPPGRWGPGDRGEIVAGVEAVVGLSTHTPEQLETALHLPVSYIAIGPVFTTDTKTTGYTGLGLEAVRRAAARTGERGVPLVAIGGVTLETAPEIIRAGAGTVAVINDLVAAGHPASRVRAYLARLTV
jgi:thiamine-phosphate pyrophosphorylase